MKRCDIIMPVWNHLDLTRDCISCIKRHTRYPHRLVLIDNASDKPTREYLGSLRLSGAGDVVIIRNEENKGFIKAVNQGMRFSDAPYVCIMNNDTMVTSGWLDEMVDIFNNNSDIGIINPSSNTYGQFPGKLDIDAYAVTLKPLSGQYQELYAGRAFAMLVKREVIDKIGYLDELYGMGYFDDTDYCKRAQKVGYKIVRAKAAYVYHKESQSFSKIAEKGAIFFENEKKFNAKWGRYLRVAYVLPGSKEKKETDSISSKINSIAKMGYQVWIFTKANFRPRLTVIDHENIRFLNNPSICFSLFVFYKILKRREKKGAHLILTNDYRIYRPFKLLENALGAPVYIDNDFPEIEKILKEVAHEGLC